MLRFLKTTLLGGIVFLVPFVLAVILVGKALALARSAVAPISHYIPITSVGGIGLATVLAAFAVLLVCFLAGLLARTQAGRWTGSRLEHQILAAVPGYAVLRGALEGARGIESKSTVRVALARIEEAWQLAFVLEEHDAGLLTVFVPSAPSATAGSVFYLTADRVKLLDVSTTSAIACIRRLGVGSGELLKGKI